MSKLDNSVTLTLNGREFKLIPTLKAAEAVSNQFNGFIGAYQALSAVSLQVAQYLVRTGTDHKDADGNSISTKDLNELVWKSGIAKLSDELTKYVRILEGGGVDPAEASNDQPQGESGGNG